MWEAEYISLRERATRLDVNTLEDALVNQPALIQEVNEVCAQVMDAHDRAKNTLDLITSQVSSTLREVHIGFDAKGNPKVRSETQITSEVIQNEDYQRAAMILQEAKLDVSLWKALTYTARARGDSVKALADMMIAGYIAPTSAYERDKEGMAEARRRSRKVT